MQLGAVSRAWNSTVQLYSSQWPHKIRSALRLQQRGIDHSPIDMRSLVSLLSMVSVHSASHWPLQHIPSLAGEFSSAAWPLLLDFVGLHVDNADFGHELEAWRWQRPFIEAARELLKDLRIPWCVRNKVKESMLTTTRTAADGTLTESHTMHFNFIDYGYDRVPSALMRAVDLYITHAAGASHLTLADGQKLSDMRFPAFFRKLAARGWDDRDWETSFASSGRDRPRPEPCSQCAWWASIDSQLLCPGCSDPRRYRELRFKRTFVFERRSTATSDIPLTAKFVISGSVLPFFSNYDADADIINEVQELQKRHNFRDMDAELEDDEMEESDEAAETDAGDVAGAGSESEVEDLQSDSDGNENS